MTNSIYDALLQQINGAAQSGNWFKALDTASMDAHSALRTGGINLSEFGALTDAILQVRNDCLIDEIRRDQQQRDIAAVRDHLESMTVYGNDAGCQQGLEAMHAIAMEASARSRAVLGAPAGAQHIGRLNKGVGAFFLKLSDAGRALEPGQYEIYILPQPR